VESTRAQATIILKIALIITHNSPVCLAENHRNIIILEQKCPLAMQAFKITIITPAWNTKAGLVI